MPNRSGGSVRGRAVAFAAVVPLLGVGAGLGTAAAPPASAHQATAQADATAQAGARVGAQIGAQQDGTGQDSGQQGSQQDGEQDVPAGEAGMPCQSEPNPEKDLPAGWAADFMQIDKLHELVPSLGEDVKVAVLDTGLGETEQLRGTEKETPIDLTSGSAQPVTDQDGFTYDCDGHGTGVAGLIAAQPGDAMGLSSDMSGIAPNVTLLPVRVTVGRDDGEARDLAAGIRAAVDADADVINVSIETGTALRELLDAVQYAQQNGVLIVAAAGNTHGSVAYPAHFAMKYENVISVGAIGQNGSITDFSSPSSVSVAAPGKNVVTTARVAGHTKMEGTSFAAPLVTGVAALLLDQSNDSGEPLTPSQVRDRLMATADPVAGEGAGSNYAGAGAISPVAVLTAIVNEQAVKADPKVQKFPGSYVPPPPDNTARNVALGVAGGAVAMSVVALGSLATVRRARKRGWRPGGV